MIIHKVSNKGFLIIEKMSYLFLNENKSTHLGLYNILFKGTESKVVEPLYTFCKEKDTFVYNAMFTRFKIPASFSKILYLWWFISKSICNLNQNTNLHT